MVKQKQLCFQAHSGWGATLLLSSPCLYIRPEFSKIRLISVFPVWSLRDVVNFIILAQIYLNLMQPRSLMYLPGPQSCCLAVVAVRFVFVASCKHRVKFDIPSMTATKHVLSKFLYIAHIQPACFDTYP